MFKKDTGMIHFDIVTNVKLNREISEQMEDDISISRTYLNTLDLLVDQSSSYRIAV